MAGAVRKTNWFAIWVSIGVVVALVAVGGLVVWMNSAAKDPGTLPESSGINQETGAIIVGDASNTFDLYLDFMCPICGDFEDLYGDEILDRVDDGTMTLNIHPISILDRYSQGTEYSSRAANAMYCVADADPAAAVGYMQALFSNQPREQTEGLTDDELIELANGVTSEDVASCITDGTFRQFVSAMTEKTPIQPGASGIGTPTIAINGEVISNSTIPEPGSLATLFD